MSTRWHISPHVASFLPPNMTHKVEQNILAAKYRFTLSFLSSLKCVCVCGSCLQYLSGESPFNLLLGFLLLCFILFCMQKTSRVISHILYLQQASVSIYNWKMWFAILVCVHGYVVVWLPKCKQSQKGKLRSLIFFLGSEWIMWVESTMTVLLLYIHGCTACVCV